MKLLTLVHNLRNSVPHKQLGDGGQNPVEKYCSEHSTNVTKAQKQLMETTITMPSPTCWMISSTDEFQLLQIMARSMGAKRTLDIGMLTGYSALSIALALPDDGQVITMDVSDQFSEVARNAFRQAGVDHKVVQRIAPAVDTLDDLIRKGESGKFDFAYIDADKGNYCNYYERCRQLLRKGGVIAIDNTLWQCKVVDPTVTDASTVAIRSLNDLIATDARVQAVMLNMADGVTIVTKL